ncbi:MAG: ATP-dependent Clp protease ATP-binding subunit, partial [Elusimicrobia bacterium]|nr:ATP-dependent Clp protease ATP-binding subunit [Elusimicrobiota bacterium]
PPQSDAQDYDPGRGLLVQFKEDVSPEQIREYAETRRLKLINPEFRGAARLVLLETLNAEDFNDTARLLAAERSGIVASIEPLLARPDLVLAAPAAPAAAEPVAEAVAAPRRDPAAAWIDWLQNVTLSDGKSKLTDDQIHMLSALLRPVAKSSDEARAPIVSRNEEVKRMLPIVTAPRGMRNSVILIGEAGVGKTAVAEGLAEMIEDSEHAVAGDKEAFLRFQRLQGRWLVELDINAVLNQKDPVGVMTELLNMLPRLNSGTASRGNDVIVLMDEIQKLLLDKSLGPKMGNALKGPLRDGKISVIATTTGREYKEYIESDDALRRRFEKIDIAEPTVEQTISILRAMKGWLQRLHDAVFPDEALVAAAKLADQFDKTNFNPDKAIKAVQDAGELSRPENLRAAITLDLRDTWGQLFVAVNEARQALVDKGIASTLALPVDLYNKIAGLVQKAESLYVERESVADGQGQVSVEVVKRVIAAKTGIGSGQLSLGEDDASRYVQMEAEVGKRVVNQDGALTAIANAVRRNKSGLSNPNRPMGKFLLTGPTGVGKTYLAKELARFLFNDPNAMIRLDMSEYMEEHTAQRMTGSPPGYVGHEAGGQLTEAVRKKPYSVILFDEIEKAHPKVFDVLLQILDDGRLTDGQGRTVDFKNTVIILTSNAGMSEVGGEKYAELLAKVEAHNQAQRDEINKTWDAEIDMLVAASLKKRFRPEFLNRLDEDPLSKNKWIRVNRLRPEDIAKIASLQLKEFQQLLADRHDTDIQFDQSVIDYLSVEGYSPLYGARPMTAAIEKNIIDPMAKWILEEANEGKKNVRGGRISVGYAEGRITFTASAKPPKNTPRATVQGATEIVTAELFKLIEGLAGVGEGEEPTSELFDRLMRKARPAATAAAAGSAGERTKAFFVPGGALEVLAPATPLEHNAAKKKDAAARAAIAATREAAAAAKWPEAVLNALEAPAGQVGEGWIKQIVRLAKEQAAKAGASAPIAVAASVDEHAIRVSVSGAHQLTEDDQRRLLAHFTGAPPQSYLEAQKKADRLNLNARMLWDHQLLDLYGRLSAIPGARMGFSNDAHGSQIWLEIKHEKAAAAPAPAVSAAAAAERKITPHQNREMAKTRDLLMRYIDQSHLKQSDQDGHAIRIAAVESFARLAAPADAALAREWIAAKGWGKALEGKEEDSSEPTIVVGTDWPLAMAAAMILERFGGAEDVEILENVSRRVMGSSHYEVPVHNALVSALSTLYARLGLDVTRKACERAAQITKVGRSADMADASKRALGSVGLPIDAESIKLDADGHVAMAKRLGRQEELLKIFRDNGMWGAMSSRDSVRQAALKLAGELETSEEALTRLKNMMKTQTSYSRTAYEMSRAWAAIAARLGRTKGLGEAITRHLEQFDLDEYHASSKHWTLLLAYVEAARLAGGADELQPLERLMSQPPNDVNSLNEQAYFTAPDAWAQALVRSGRFEEYARSQGLSNGAPRPSKLQEMLMSKDRPMLVAAASERRRRKSAR